MLIISILSPPSAWTRALSSSRRPAGYTLGLLHQRRTAAKAQKTGRRKANEQRPLTVVSGRRRSLGGKWDKFRCKCQFIALHFNLNSSIWPQVQRSSEQSRSDCSGLLADKQELALVCLFWPCFPPLLLLFCSLLLLSFCSHSALVLLELKALPTADCLSLMAANSVRTIGPQREPLPLPFPLLVPVPLPVSVPLSLRCPLLAPVLNPVVLHSRTSARSTALARCQNVSVALISSGQTGRPVEPQSAANSLQPTVCPPTLLVPPNCGPKLTPLLAISQQKSPLLRVGSYRNL